MREHYKMTNTEERKTLKEWGYTNSEVITLHRLSNIIEDNKLFAKHCVDTLLFHGDYALMKKIENLWMQ